MVGGPLAAQTPPPRDPSPHSDAVLVSDRAAVRPGDTLSVAVRLTLDAGWHTYWINPGDAGLPPTPASPSAFGGHCPQTSRQARCNSRHRV